RTKSAVFVFLILSIFLIGGVTPIHSVDAAADVRIFIDPGHGGSDPMASAKGLQEKDITLDIAIKTRDILNEQYSGHTVKLSRTEDITKSLNERTNEATNWGANFFVSIHINSNQATGYESYPYICDYVGKERTNAIRRSIHN